MRCTNCNIKTHTKAKYCSNCGQSITRSRFVLPKLTRKSSLTLGVIGIGVILLYAFTEPFFLGENLEPKLIIGSWERIDESGIPTGSIYSFGKDGFTTQWKRTKSEVQEGAYRWENSDQITNRFYFDASGKPVLLEYNTGFSLLLKIN